MFTRKPLLQQVDAGAGGAGAGGAGAAAGAAAAGDAGKKTDGAQDASGKTGTTTDAGKGAADTSASKPAPFVPKLPGDKKIDNDPALKEYFGKFNAIFADEKLQPAERMQKLVDLNIEHGQKVSEATQKKAREEQDRLAAQPARDLETLKTDKDFGGPNYQATVDGAKRIERLAFGEDLSKLLAPFGMQNDPVIVRGLARLSRLIAEDSVGDKVGSGPSGEASAEQQGRAMFPKSYDKMKAASKR